ncbi:hypothetical protein TGAMA5MH_09175 [Trichoderma gamsii]|uniref:Uncharacterized protein n=1 Tax=Trichoderma gamsii TaxID=398673 RepID=A0A2K0T0A3_9HYPO|nr:hypothetical protein TGAMA5MH_09175 [Trichoderma gamsii]
MGTASTTRSSWCSTPRIRGAPLLQARPNPTHLLGDTINRINPSGHFSLFGQQFIWRDLVITVVGTAVGIAFGVLTRGAGFAIEAGLAIVVGAASDPITGIFYDSVTGKRVTLSKMGIGLVFSLIGGIVGEGIGRAIGAAGRAALRGLRGTLEALSNLVRNAEKLKIAGGRTNEGEAETSLSTSQTSSTGPGD